MTDKLREDIKKSFEVGQYDIIDSILEKNIVKLTLENYDSFCKEIINILNHVRINRPILDEEKFYPYEEYFANRFYDGIRDSLIRNEDFDELPDEVFQNIKGYYLMIKNIGSMGIGSYEEELDNEKTK